MLLTEDDLDPYFDGAQRDVFRLEALHAYAVDVEAPRFRAYMAGEPYDPAAEPHAWYEYIGASVATGVTWRKVRILRSPLTEYERWECEWSYTATERHGQRTHILDLAETAAPAELPAYDWWMFDEAVVLRMHYDDAGVFTGAERLEDNLVRDHVRYRDEALRTGVPFPAYWETHPQHWRDNWLTCT